MVVGTCADLELARDRAVSFLLASRGERGWWRDFETLAGDSDEWVTGYVGVVLARVPDERASASARVAWKRLRMRRLWAPGWGYNARIPSDADSTTWGVRLAEELGDGESWRARRAARALEQHMDVDGGVSTYAVDGPIRHFTRVNRSVSFAGWCAPHVCVTAAAAGLRGLPRRHEVLRWLKDRRQPDGRWVGYWWRDDEYPTALAVAALSGEPANREVVADASRWAAARVRAGRSMPSAPGIGGSPFALASALKVMLSADRSQHDDAIRTAVATLIGTQREDGSWEPSAAMQIPPPDVTDPATFQGFSGDKRAAGALPVDGSACFTTATVLSALQLAVDRGR